MRKPQVVEGLKDKKVVHVAVGALHCLAVTDQGQVFAWGDNDHGQQVSVVSVHNLFLENQSLLLLYSFQEKCDK